MACETFSGNYETDYTMKPVQCVVLLAVVAFGFSSCGSLPMASVKSEESGIRMAQIAENEYELRIYDEGFTKWFGRHARPINSHSPEYYEQINDQYAAIWNQKAADKRLSLINTPVHTPIDYDPTIDYGPQIDYLLFNYFRYVEYRYGRLIKSPKDALSIPASGPALTQR